MAKQKSETKIKTDKNKKDSVKLPNSKEEKLDELLNELPPEVREVIIKLPEEDRIVIASSITSYTYQGPIPHPSILRGYENVISGSAERLLTQFEKQTNHRHNIEAKVINSQIEDSKRGQIFAFILASICLILGTVFVFTGHPVVAGTVFTTTIIGLVTVFLTGKKRQKKNLHD